jgi:hypothetical protein
VDGEALSPLPGLLDDRRLGDIDHLLDHVQLAQPVQPRFLVRQAVEQDVMLLHDILRVAKPVVDETEGAVGKSGGDPAAPVMAANDDVLHAQHVHRVLDHREAVQVGVDHDVGDVSMNEQVPRRKTDDLVGRHAAVRATDPQVARVLLPGQRLEE